MYKQLYVAAGGTILIVLYNNINNRGIQIEKGGIFAKCTSTAKEDDLRRKYVWKILFITLRPSRK